MKATKEMAGNEMAMRLLEKEAQAYTLAASLTDAVVEVVRKFDGKQANKRLDTALKTVNENLYFKLEYNSFIIGIYIKDRSINCGPHWSYIKNHTISLIHAAQRSAYGDSALTEDGRIIAESVIKSLKEGETYYLEYANNLHRDASRIDDMRRDIDKINAAIDEYKKKYTSSAREYATDILHARIYC